MSLTDKQLYRVIDDVNSYYRVTSESKKELLLNKYPNAAAAYSLRLLDGYYRGPLVRVRRDSDGAEVDVYPDYNNQLSLDSLVTNVADANDTTEFPDIDADATFLKSLNSLGEFVSNPNYVDGGTATDATVCVWYDQSSTDGVANNNDAEQITATNQPLIVSSGVMVTENGKPAIQTDGSDDTMSLTSTISFSDLTWFTVTRKSDDDGKRSIIFYQTNAAYGGDDVDNQGNPRLKTTGGDIIRRNPLGNTSESGGEINQHLSYYNRNGTNASGGLNGEVNAEATVATTAFELTKLFQYGGNYRYEGLVQELVLYDSSQKSNRTGIEEDINDFYQIDGYEPQQPLIDLTQQLAVQNGDTIADGTPAAAYSLRTLSSTYAGPLVRVRRSTDDVEVDVYADSEGSFSLLSPITDGGNEQSDPYLGNSSVGSTTKTKLYEFVYGQSCDLTVVTWYDQASGNNATQATTGNQPKIYDSSTGVITKNGNYAAYSGSGQHLISGTPISNDGNWLALAVAARIDSTAKAMGLQASSFVAQLINYNSTYLQTIGYNGSVVSDISIAFTATTDMKLLCSQLASGTLEAIVNGQSNGGVSLVNQVTTAQPLGIFCKGSASETFNGYISEAILYVSDQSANRTDIEQNINTYYSIY